MSQARFLHDSRMPFYRKPVGAAPCLSVIRLALSVSNKFPADAVFLRTWQNGGGEELLAMHASGQTGENTVYETTFITPAHPGIVWYYFVIHTGGEVSYWGNNDQEWGESGPFMTLRHRHIRSRCIYQRR